jgi:hypothetical protein
MTPILWKAVDPSVGAKQKYEADYTPSGARDDEHRTILAASMVK